MDNEGNEANTYKQLILKVTPVHCGRGSDSDWRVASPSFPGTPEDGEAKSGYLCGSPAGPRDRREAAEAAA